MLLRRIWPTDTSTFGVLIRTGKPFMLTLEQRWDFNKPNGSCIPTGTYTAIRVVSPRFGETFEIANVPGRAAILFHAGNTSEDTEGCILLGRSFGMINGIAGIKDSKLALADFMDSLKGSDEFTIIIQDKY